MINMTVILHYTDKNFENNKTKKNK